MTKQYDNSIRRFSPEVLAPAGNLRCLKTAVDFGADAVYCAGKMFGMRTAPKNFTMEELQEGLRYAHERGAKVYITCNVLPTNPEVDGVEEYIGQLADLGVDAVIVADIGLLMLARRVAPQLEIHISTQAGVVNYLTANSLAELGASRVVLARELSLDAVREIRARVPRSVDIECFVHGSMCMAFSGRCLISQYMTGRDANHGDCAQSCRWKYSVVEEKRPGQFYPIEQREEGAYLFNSEDMNMLEHIDDLIDAGVTSLKIEGRAKSAYYVATTTNAYKTAVNMVLEARNEGVQGHIELPQWLKEEPYKIVHRPYCTGFYYPESPASQTTDKGGYTNDWLVVGDVQGYEDGRVIFKAHNRILEGQTIEFVRPALPPFSFEVHDIHDEYGHIVESANRPTHTYSFPCPQEFEVGTAMRSKTVRPALKVAQPAAAEQQDNSASNNSCACKH